MNMQICYSTTCFGPEQKPDDLLRWLEIIRATGITTVEISRKHFDIARRVEKINNLGIKVWSIHGTLGFEAISDNKGIREEAIANEIARMKDTATFATCPYVIHYLDRFNDPVYGQRFKTAIEKLIKANENFGFTLAIETAPHKPLENERYPDSVEIANFVRSFANDKVKMTIDINHSNLNEDIISVCHNCKDLIANIHVSDNHGKYEEHLLPGMGNIPIKQVMQKMRKCNYNGPCNLELHLSQMPNYEILSKANDKVKQILA